MAGEVETHAGNPATNWHDIIERAAWTAVQAFAGAIPSAALIEAISEVDLSTLETLALAGFGAAGSALLSFVKTLAQEKLRFRDTRA